MVTANEDERAEFRDRMYREAEAAAAIGRQSPLCLFGDGRMRKDNFNGMWVCSHPNHGGYQTREQVARLLYAEYMEMSGYPL